MKRNEEIEKEAAFRYPEMTSKYIAFIKGAKYADKTMLDRACEWLKNNIDLYSETAFSIKSGYTEITLTDKFKTAFRQAMKGE